MLPVGWPTQNITSYYNTTSMTFKFKISRLTSFCYLTSINYMLVCITFVANIMSKYVTFCPKFNHLQDFLLINFLFISEFLTKAASVIL